MQRKIKNIYRKQKEFILDMIKKYLHEKLD